MKKYWLHIVLIVTMTGLLLEGYRWVDQEPSLELKSLQTAPNALETKTANALKAKAWKDLPPALRPFEDLLSISPQTAQVALKEIEKSWHPGYPVMLIEVSRLLSPNTRAGIGADIVDLLTKKTGQSFGADWTAWLRWVWTEELETHSGYAAFKANLYSRIDPRFAEYFDDSPAAEIQLEEIQWGGVRRDGIPPLKSPKVISAAEATWLDDDDVVFGVAVNGETRAYPKRILAWHEMAKDTIGGESLCCVYCTLCGSMIVYQTELNDRHYELGTSGFLYRSNKLMYDHSTQSMWSTLSGKPVVGPLVGQQIQLNRLSMVTTTWKEWRLRHPETTVLSLETGHRRDYGEGVAYRSYFATDKLMFDVSLKDSRLANKESVFALRTEIPKPDRLAITKNFLLENPVYHDRIGDRNIVIVTELQGASRAYYSEDLLFTHFDQGTTLLDKEGKPWILDEDSLQSPGKTLRRVPSHDAFWFGWYAAFPETRLVKRSGRNN